MKINYQILVTKNFSILLFGINLIKHANSVERQNFFLIILIAQCHKQNFVKLILLQNRAVPYGVLLLFT